MECSCCCLQWVQLWFSCFDMSTCLPLKKAPPRPRCSFGASERSERSYGRVIRRHVEKNARASSHECAVTWKTLLQASWNQHALWTRQLRVARYRWLHHCVRCSCCAGSFKAQTQEETIPQTNRTSVSNPRLWITLNVWHHAFRWVLSQETEGGLLLWRP